MSVCRIALQIKIPHYKSMKAINLFHHQLRDGHGFRNQRDVQLEQFKLCIIGGNIPSMDQKHVDQMSLSIKFSAYKAKA